MRQDYLKRAHVEKPFDAQMALDYASLLLEMNEYEGVSTVIRPFMQNHPNGICFFFIRALSTFSKKNINPLFRFSKII